MYFDCFVVSGSRSREWEALWGFPLPQIFLVQIDKKLSEKKKSDIIKR